MSDGSNAPIMMKDMCITSVIHACVRSNLYIKTVLVDSS